MLLGRRHGCGHAGNLSFDALEVTDADSPVAEEVMQRVEGHKLLPQTCIVRILTTLMLE